MAREIRLDGRGRRPHRWGARHRRGHREGARGRRGRGRDRRPRRRPGEEVGRGVRRARPAARRLRSARRSRSSSTAGREGARAARRPGQQRRLHGARQGAGRARWSASWPRSTSTSRASSTAAYEAAERMSSGGVIVNIASLAGRIPMPGSAVYSATKAGVLAFSESLDAELAPKGIRVGCRAAVVHQHRADRRHPRHRVDEADRADGHRGRCRAADRLAQVTTTVPKLFAFSGANWSLTSAR